MTERILDGAYKDLESHISQLPKGSITKKEVKGHTYFYRRWTEDGVRKERYIPKDELEHVKKQIELRKKLENELQSQRKGSKTLKELSPFRLNVTTGSTLKRNAEEVSNYRRRDCYISVRNYIFDDRPGKILVLYGLRRTGKTTLIKQIILEMDDTLLNKTASITVNREDTTFDLNHDMAILEEQGYEFVFIDEVTLADNFVETSSVLSNRFASNGMKIILSGTDSLGFMFAEDDSLYDRCITIHTTHIPYREFNRVLGKTDIDRYIEYGGTMNPEGINYNIDSKVKDVGQYVNSAIAYNIQHALSQYKYGGHFGALRELYDKGELTNVINRIVEDINHRFALDVLTKDFRSNDYALAANNILRSGSPLEVSLNKIDVENVTNYLKTALDILDRYERSIDLEEVHVQEIEAYLSMLDVITDVTIRRTATGMNKTIRTVVTQPGLRYAQAEALVKSLKEDSGFNELSKEERAGIEKRMIDSIRGRMMEDIVLSETQAALPQSNVFVLQFPAGEFDMVIEDDIGCKIFEIKHSDKAVPHQYRHLINEEMCAKTVYHYGPIQEKCVIYRGETHWEGEIHYVNVEEYLIGLGDPTASGSASSCSHGHSG